VQYQIEGLVGGRVVAARNCPGGFSPGFASTLALADGGRAFAKAIDIRTWPSQAGFYQDEARNAAGLTQAGLAHALPTPGLLGSCDDGRYVVLAFEYVDGREPDSPWQPDQLAAVAAAVARMSALLTPSPLTAPEDHPRLGGWAELAADSRSLGRLFTLSDWAGGHLDCLIALERLGLVAARGTALVHFDALPHNVLLTAEGAVLVDWPHARLGAPVIDLLTLLASAAADGIDPEPVLRAVPVASDPRDIDAVLAALAGFWLADGLGPMSPGFEPIAAAKLHLGRGGLGWLLHRLGAGATMPASPIPASTVPASTCLPILRGRARAVDDASHCLRPLEHGLDGDSARSLQHQPD
jgi:hypothetical protein